MSKRPNILWLYCDELRTDALGCYGNPKVPVQTPHLDRLAAEGTRFTRSYCNTPICVASRASILTGQYPEQNGIYSNEGAWRNFKHDVTARTFPEVFADHGYTTATFGKSHVPPSMTPWQFEDVSGGGMGECDAKMADNPRSHIPVSLRCGTVPIDVPYGPNKVADNAIRFMQEQRDSDQPWLLRASWLQPHTPVLPPAPWGEMYMHCDVDLGEPDLSKLSRPDRLWIKEMGQRFAKVGADMRAVHLRYYGLASWMDSQVGQVLAALDALGQRDNTVVIFTADHGCMAGNWGISGKHLFHPYSQQVPLIYRAPQGVEAGAVREDINESLDLATTLFGLAGIEPEEDHFQGRDLFNEPEPEAVFGTIGYGYPCSYLAPNGGVGAFPNGGWPRRTCVRTRDYRFEKTVKLDGQAPAASDTDAFLAVSTEDPCEQVNRADEPGLQDVVARLSALIDQHAEGSVEVPAEYVDRELRHG